VCALCLVSFDTDIYRIRIGYVEFRTIDMVDKALSLSGTVVMGLPIMVQLTEAERNRLHPGDGYVSCPVCFPLLIDVFAEI